MKLTLNVKIQGDLLIGFRLPEGHVFNIGHVQCTCLEIVEHGIKFGANDHIEHDSLKSGWFDAQVLQCTSSYFQFSCAGSQYTWRPFDKRFEWKTDLDAFRQFIFSGSHTVPLLPTYQPSNRLKDIIKEEMHGALPSSLRRLVGLNITRFKR